MKDKMTYVNIELEIPITKEFDEIYRIIKITEMLQNVTEE